MSHQLLIPKQLLSTVLLAIFLVIGLLVTLPDQAVADDIKAGAVIDIKNDSKTEQGCTFFSKCIKNDTTSKNFSGKNLFGANLHNTNLSRSDLSVPI